MSYSEALEATKAGYPFDRWYESSLPDEDGSEGLTQYSRENCDAVKSIFDSLIAALQEKGQGASEADKVALFEKAVLALNDLDAQISGLIETGEREDLCELINEISVATGLDPEQYGDGEGLASEWREW